MEHEITDTKLLVTDSLYQNYQYLRLRISSFPISRALKSALVAQQNRKKKKEWSLEKNSGERLYRDRFSGGDSLPPTAPPRRKSSQVPPKFIILLTQRRSQNQSGRISFLETPRSSSSPLHPSSLSTTNLSDKTKWRTKCMTVPLALIWVCLLLLFRCSWCCCRGVLFLCAIGRLAS